MILSKIKQKIFNFIHPKPQPFVCGCPLNHSSPAAHVRAYAPGCDPVFNFMLNDPIPNGAIPTYQLDNVLINSTNMYIMDENGKAQSVTLNEKNLLIPSIHPRMDADMVRKFIQSCCEKITVNRQMGSKESFYWREIYRDSTHMYLAPDAELFGVICFYGHDVGCFIETGALINIGSIRKFPLTLVAFL